MEQGSYALLQTAIGGPMYAVAGYLVAYIAYQMKGAAICQRALLVIFLYAIFLYHEAHANVPVKCAFGQCIVATTTVDAYNIKLGYELRKPACLQRKVGLF